MNRKQYNTMIESVAMSDALRDALLSAYEPCFEGAFRNTLLSIPLALGIGLGATNADAKPINHKSGKATTHMVQKKQAPAVKRTSHSGTVKSSQMSQADRNAREDAIFYLMMYQNMSPEKASHTVDVYSVMHFKGKPNPYTLTLADAKAGKLK